MFEVQTRDHDGGLRNFPSLKAAITAARQDSSIWKISFELPNGERCRMVFKDSRWVYSPLVDEPSDDVQLL